MEAELLSHLAATKVQTAWRRGRGKCGLAQLGRELFGEIGARARATAEAEKEGAGRVAAELMAGVERKRAESTEVELEAAHGELAVWPKQHIRDGSYYCHPLTDILHLRFGPRRRRCGGRMICEAAT